MCRLSAGGLTSGPAFSTDQTTRPLLSSDLRVRRFELPMYVAVWSISVDMSSKPLAVSYHYVPGFP